MPLLPIMLRSLVRAVFLLGVVIPLSAAANPQDNAAENWPSIKTEIFGASEVREEDGVIGLEAPDRSEDAAITPVTIIVSKENVRRVKRVVLVIDNNPAPVAGTFTFGPAAPSGEQRISTRVRVDRFTFMRALAELDDGTVYMVKRFIKASGGCSAPASKDAEAALRDMGKLQFTSQSIEGMSDVTLMVRHPNFSGLQIDQVTHGYTPSRFVNDIEITRGSQLLVKIEAGISISENPYFRLHYAPDGGDEVRAVVKETGGLVFGAVVKSKGS